MSGLRAPGKFADKNHVHSRGSQLGAGDIVVLELSNIVAADIRLIESDKTIGQMSRH